MYDFKSAKVINDLDGPIALKGFCEVNMSFNQIVEQSGIPLLLFVICAYYAFRLLVFKDYETVRGRDKEAPKDVDGYCKTAGLIIVFYGLSTLVMAGIVLVSPVAGLAQIIVCTIIMIFLWKKMSDKYS